MLHRATFGAASTLLGATIAHSFSQTPLWTKISSCSCELVGSLSLGNKISPLPMRTSCRCSNRPWIYILTLMPEPQLKSEEGALSLKAFQFEFAKRTRRNEFSQLRVGRFAQAAEFS